MIFFMGVLLLVAGQAAAATTLEPPTLAIRLQPAVSTRTVRVGDALEGVVIAPARYEGRVLIPAGWKVCGRVAAVEKANGRERLRLDFHEVLHPDGAVLPIQYRGHGHHIRTYRRPESFGGFPVWSGAATHDVAIEYSYQRGKFIHRIDSAIDKEREKIVNDLLFTGRVRGRALIGRPGVPNETPTASGILMKTDGRVAVVLLASVAGETP